LLPVGATSRRGVPLRALALTYIFAVLLVLIGDLNFVAFLLSMCFLMAYAFMNFTCFSLTWLKSTAWRPKGAHRKRWRGWYLSAGGCGFVLCLSVMFMVNAIVATCAVFLSLCMYIYVNWQAEEREWGSALDGIRFQLALNSLIQLEDHQQHVVNWRPHVLILYRIHLADELKGIQHHEILRFYSCLRKAHGFCVVACVLESENRDETTLHKASVEKDVIKAIMKEENIKGFAEVVVAPSWGEGTNYIIQLTGVGGLVPNTVLLEWPVRWQKHPQRAHDFVQVLNTALAKEKAVLAVKGLQRMPTNVVHGTIDIWWMIHDGGFMILMCWLLMNHRIWRNCHLRVFTVTEDVSAERAKKAAQALTRTLRQRRLVDVEVEVILADDDMIEPFTYDWTLRVEDRHKFLQRLHPGRSAKESIPLEIDDLFALEEEDRNTVVDEEEKDLEDRTRVAVSDVRTESEGMRRRKHTHEIRTVRDSAESESSVKVDRVERDPFRPRYIPGFHLDGNTPDDELSTTMSEIKHVSGTLVVDTDPRVNQDSNSSSTVPVDEAQRKPEAREDEIISHVCAAGKGASEVSGGAKSPLMSEAQSSEKIFESSSSSDRAERGPAWKRPKQRHWNASEEPSDTRSFAKLNEIVLSRSKRAQLVIMNLPDLWGTEPEEVKSYMSFCETLTSGLDCVLFVHSSGHEIFDIDV